MLASLLDRVNRARRKLKCERSGAIYRGQRIGPIRQDGTKGWGLCPQLFRANCKSAPLKAERNYYENFVSYAGSQIERGKSSWEILAEMQHHGAHTRLLDWSESLAVGMYFAVMYQPTKERDNPCIWVSNAYRFNQWTLRKCKYKSDLGIPETTNLPPTTVNFCVPSYPTFDYAKTIFRKDMEWPFEHPFVMESPYTTSRLRAQKGLFTVHGTNISNVENIMAEFVEPVVLTHEEVSAVKQHLSDMGLDHYSFFPNLDGLAETLNEAYFR